MSLYEIEKILNQYSFEFDSSLDKKDKLRRLKCGFCNCLFKYQVCLNNHVNTKHMVDLKELSNLERLSFIRLFNEDDRDISYAQFHKEYFIQKNNLSLSINCWKIGTLIKSRYFWQSNKPVHRIFQVDQLWPRISRDSVVKTASGLILIEVQTLNSITHAFE